MLNPMNDWDIYLAITTITQQCANVEFQYIHMKGHQDKDLSMYSV